MRNFRNLQVWQKSHELTLQIYKATAEYPKSELFALTSQTRRAAASISANLAEGYGRGSDAEFGRFLHIAAGSACELEYHLILAHDLEFLPDEIYIPLDSEVNEIKRMLAALQQKLKAKSSVTSTRIGILHLTPAMKNIFTRFALLALLLGALLCFSRPSSANTPQAIGNKVSGFYKWYVGEVKKYKEPSKNRAIMPKYASRRLWKWLNSKAYEDFGADYFLDAQDFADDWDKAKVSDVRIKGNVATMKVTLGSVKPKDRDMGQQDLQIKMVKEAGAWKIDRVNGN